MKSIDSAYPLLSRLMKPYASGTQNADQALFNLVMSSSRIKIEHAFGGLVSRWRFLWKHLYLLNDQRLAKTIYACCTLTNICIDQNDADYSTSTSLQGFEEFTQRDEEITINLEDITLPVADINATESDAPRNLRPTQEQINESKEAGIARREQIKRELWCMLE